MQAFPCVSSNAPSFCSSEELSHVQFDFVFTWGGKPVWGLHRPCRRGLAMCKPWETRLPSALQRKNILVITYTKMYARYQSSLGYLAWHYCCMSVTEGKIRGKYHQETNVPRSNLAMSRIHKNKERHTAHAIISWPNPKQWMIVHTSGFMIASI